MARGMVEAASTEASWGRDVGDAFGPGPGRIPHEALARPGRRAGAVRRVPPGMPTPPGTAGAVLRSDAIRRRDRPHDLRPIQRVLRRSHREEAAEPLPPGNPGAVVRHGRLQPGVPLLPELGHLQVAGDRHAGGSGVTRAHRPGGPGAGVPQRRFHLQRPRDLHGVRHGRGRRLPRARDQSGGGHRGLRLSRAAGRALLPHGRGERRPQGVQRGLLPSGLLRRTRPGPGDARLPEARNRGVVRDHEPPDPGAERFERGDRRHDPVGGRSRSIPIGRCGTGRPPRRRP